MAPAPVNPGERIAAAAGALTAHGYGLGAAALAAELGRLGSPREFIYTLGRAAEKLGREAFDDALASPDEEGARALTAHGYGMGAEALAAELAALAAPYEVLYTLARCAEKLGEDAFDAALAALD